MSMSQIIAGQVQAVRHAKRYFPQLVKQRQQKLEEILDRSRKHFDDSA